MTLFERNLSQLNGGRNKRESLQADRVEMENDWCNYDVLFSESEDLD